MEHREAEEQTPPDAALFTRIASKHILFRQDLLPGAAQVGFQPLTETAHQRGRYQQNNDSRQSINGHSRNEEQMKGSTARSKNNGRIVSGDTHWQGAMDVPEGARWSVSLHFGGWEPGSTTPETKSGKVGSPGGYRRPDAYPKDQE